MASEITHVGDTGTTIDKVIWEDGVLLDMSTATSILIRFEAPDGTTTQVTAVLLTDGTDGAIRGVSEVGTWTMPGRWYEQVQFTTPAGAWSTVAEQRIVREAI